MAANPDAAGFGVYVHWPFCASKCPYCDFNSHVRSAGIDEARFLAAYLREIETIAARDRTRFFLSLSVVCALKPAGLRNLRDALLRCVRSHPKVWPDVVRVHFTGLTDSTIPVEITAWFQTTEQDQFLEARQELLLQILEVIEQFGATPAFVKASGAPHPGK